jgi:hypothetical protein
VTLLSPRRTLASPGPRTAALGASAGLAAAAAFAVRARTRRGRAGEEATGDRQDHPAGIEEWQCSCGQRYRVSGAGRHRIFWLADAETADPVLSDRCPNCDETLPAQA